MAGKRASAATQATLTNCDREPIHLSGAIQPHGILLALDKTSLRITQASENTRGFFGWGPGELWGRSIEDIVHGAAFADVETAARQSNIEDVNPIAMRVRTPGGEVAVDAILHRSGEQIVLELEPVDATRAESAHEFHRVVRGSIARLGSARTVEQLCRAAVEQVAYVSGFDRVMIYRFDDDWHGEVIVEKRADDMVQFLGLHYPASDIPLQARELFRTNWLRFIPDVNHHAVAILSARGSDGEPLDLSRSVLRSVSPLHIEYLQNMGVAASMTISLLKNGELWGLVACHHRSPKTVPYEVRFACEIIGRTMSLHLGSLEENADSEYRMKLKSAQLRLLEAMSKDADFWPTLAAAEPDLLSLVGAQGAAICYGAECKLVGQTPERADVMALVAWLAASGSDDVFVTDALPLLEPRFEHLAPTACGVIAFSLSHARSSYVIWFRPEVLVTVNWAGDPTKALETSANGERLTPRKSFELWCEIVRLHSLRWRSYEVDAAREWRHFVGSLIIERAEQLERVNRELARSNVELDSLLRSNIELDSFAHIASHDLKEPLRGIHNYAGFLLEDYGAVVGEDGREKLSTLVRLSQRMEALIDSLLALSSIGRIDLSGSATDLRALIDGVLEIYMPRLTQARGSVSIVTPLPNVFVDGVRVSEVFNNLFSNAIKYCEGPPHIEIGVDRERQPPDEIARASSTLVSPGTYVTVFVRDTGIGIRKKHLESIFNMFKRLHASHVYGGGTGAGLAIARKIVERHGGQMWAESTFGEGTTFYFTLPASP